MIAMTKDEIRKLNDSFETIEECCGRIEEAQQYINSLIESGKVSSDAISKQRNKRKYSNPIAPKKIRIGDRVWKSVTQFAKEHGMSNATPIYIVAKKHGITIEERCAQIHNGINVRRRPKRK